ncbi:MAG TPA: HNH endonuclease signature motif containing protein [Polyangiaceae bacterium]|nr:HNH endonuclease signature motif containing protein [Polyangiaceae bacterium]
MNEWQIAHETLSRLARERAAADALEGHWLLRARRAQAHLHTGFGNFVSYVEQLFGYTPRSILEKLRVAEALEQLPVARAALEQGRLGWSAVRELTRVAVRETEEVWLDAARGKTVRQLEQLIAGKRPGDVPSDKPDSRAVRHVLRFEVSAETYALFREALLELRRRSSSCFGDDAALLEMARCILGGSAHKRRDEGRASYQIAVSICPECGNGRQPTNGQLVAIAPEILAMAECDAQRLPELAGHAAHETPQFGDASAAHRPAAVGVCPHVDTTEHQPEHDDRSGTLTQLGSTGSERHPAHEAHVTACAHVGSSVDEHRSTYEGRALVDTNMGRTGGAPAPAGRAKQDIPPALRRAVLRRDERRCRVAGCRNATFLDQHHIRPRSEGGSHSPDNLVTLCSAHHRAIHRGELRSAGDASDFRVLPGIPGMPVDGDEPPMAPSSLDVSAKVASGLCQLGFRAADVRAVMAELRQQSELASAAPQQWLREALRRLHPAPARPR